MNIIEAGDGLDGLQRAVEGQPDLLLLDLKMPGLDGIAVARQLKDDPRTRTIPILVMSACRDTDSKVEAFSAGGRVGISGRPGFGVKDSNLNFNVLAVGLDGLLESAAGAAELVEGGLRSRVALSF